MKTIKKLVFECLTIVPQQSLICDIPTYRAHIAIHRNPSTYLRSKEVK